MAAPKILLLLILSVPILLDAQTTKQWEKGFDIAKGMENYVGGHFSYLPKTLRFQSGDIGISTTFYFYGSYRKFDTPITEDSLTESGGSWEFELGQIQFLDLFYVHHMDGYSVSLHFYRLQDSETTLRGQSFMDRLIPRIGLIYPYKKAKIELYLTVRGSRNIGFSYSW